MVKQYSADLRERLLGAIDADLSQTEAARLLGESTIKRWRRRVTREAEPALVAQVQAAPDATLGEHCAA